MNKDEKKINDLLKAEFEKSVPDIKSKIMQAAENPDLDKYNDPALFSEPTVENKNLNSTTNVNDNSNHYSVVSSWFGRKINLVATAVVIFLVIGIVGYGVTSRLNIQTSVNPSSPGIENLSAKNYDEVMTAVKKINDSVGVRMYDLEGSDSSGSPINGITSSSNATTAIMPATAGAPNTAETSGTLAQLIDAPDISGTNNQVSQVEESDIVKVDANYLYAIVVDTDKNGNSGKFLIIVSIADPAKMKVVYKNNLGEEFYSGYEMYLTGDRLTIITPFTKDHPVDNGTTGNISKAVPPSGGVYANPGISTYSSPSISTYSSPSISAYSSPNTGVYSVPRISIDNAQGINHPQPANMTKTTVYNISDRTNPTIERTLIQDGNYVSSRLIDNNLYTVSTKYIPYVQPDTTPNPDKVIPQVCESGDNNFQLIPADKIMIPNEPTQSVFTVVSGLDIADSTKKADTVSVLGSAGTIYSTRDNMYISSNSRVFTPDIMVNSSNESFPNPGNNVGGTEILKFNLDSGNVVVKERTEVPGNILNQYSMDEFNGNLRVATTYYNNANDGGGALVSGMYVFDDKLAFLGKVDGIAPSETIKSVRFTGDKGYIVTFKQMDPFFVIDLSDPANPKLQGELKLPGYSDYMHPYSDNLMIGVGYDTTGIRGSASNLKVSLFDVSDPENPKEVSKYIFKEDMSTSGVTSDLKAFLFSKDKNIIGFPLSYAGGNSNAITTFGYAVMGVNEADKQIYLRGKEIQTTYTVGGTRELANGYNPVLRGCYVGNALFTVSNQSIKSTSLDSFSEISTLSLG